MKHNTILFAFILLIVGNLFATFADVLVKYFAAGGGIYQYLFMRQLTVMVIILPFWLRQSKQTRAAGNIKVQGVRAILANIGGGATVVALLYLPLATANVIFYAAPMLTILIATLFLNEKIKRHRLVAMFIGFTGIAIAMRPEYVNFAGLAALVTAISVAMFNISVRWLPPGTSTTSTIFWTNILAMPITGTIALFNWGPITSELIIMSVGACLCLLIYQGSCIVAFRNADASAIAISEYSGLVFAAILGWIIFSEHIDEFTIAGIVLIIAPIIWQSVRENKAQTSNASSVLVLDESEGT